MPLVVQASVPSIISYQGRLTDSSGNLLGGSSGTNYYFKFSLWDNSTVGSGSKVWPTSDPGSVTASVKQGVFNVNIGDTDNDYPDALDYTFSGTVYLQVEASANNVDFEILSPRLQITSAAFAQVAESVSGTGYYLDSSGLLVTTATMTSATTSNLAITGLLNSLLKTNALGSIIPAVAGVDFFDSDSLQSFLHASTTIPKTYSDNIWSGSNTFDRGILFTGVQTISSNGNSFKIFDGDGGGSFSVNGIFDMSAGGGYWEIHGDNGVDLRHNLNSNLISLDGNGGNDIVLFPGSDSQRVVVPRGLVGIGTGSPAEKLEVAGNIKANNLTIGSGSITDSSGAISFGDENISSTGSGTFTGVRSDGGIGVGVAPSSFTGLGATLTADDLENIKGLSNTFTMSGHDTTASGLDNVVTITGADSSAYGVYNQISGSGLSGDIWGIYNWLDSSTADSQIYGEQTWIFPSLPSNTVYGNNILGMGAIDNPSVDQMGLYLNWALTGADASNKKWALYNDSSNTTAGKVFLGKDNVKTYWGTDYDASIYFDGTNLVIDSLGALSTTNFITTNSTSTSATTTNLYISGSLTKNTTDLVTNLNADLWDGYQFSNYLDQAVKQASSPTFAGLTVGSLSGLIKGTAGALSAAVAGTDYESPIASGLTTQFWRGDKTWQTLNQAAVAGLTTTDSPTFAGLTISGTEATIAAPAADNGSDLNYAGTGYTASGPYTHSIRVYSYKTVNGLRVYSSDYLEIGPLTDAGDESTYSIDWAWTAAAGADGYRVLKQEDFTPYNYEVYYDVATNSFEDTNSEFVSGSTVTPTSAYSNLLSFNGQLSNLYAAGTLNLVGSLSVVGDLDVRDAYKSGGVEILKAGATNTLIGQGAGSSLTTGINNTFVGVNAGDSTNSGSDNIVIGYEADATGAQSIVIGDSVSVTASNVAVIGGTGGIINDVYFGSGVTYQYGNPVTIQPTGSSGTNAGGDALTLAGGKSTGNQAGGNVIFSVSPAGASGTSLNGLVAQLKVTDGTLQPITTNDIDLGASTKAFKDFYLAGKAYTSGLTAAAGTPYTLCQNSATGEVTVNAAQTCTVSSLAFKHDINLLSDSGLEMINSLKPSSFVYNEGDGKERWGFIAEDLASVAPQLATYNASGTPHSIDLPGILAITVKAVQELGLKVEKLGATAIGYFTELFADRATLKELCLTDDAGVKTCLTRSQLDKLLSGQNVQPEPETNPEVPQSESQPEPESEPSATSTPPVEEIEEVASTTPQVEPEPETPPEPEPEPESEVLPTEDVNLTPDEPLI